MTALVEIRDVHKTYKRDQFEVAVLNGVTLDVAEGEFLALMGPSGSGKTTLLNLIAGIDRPTRGSIMVAGKQISTMNETKLADWRSRHVGFIFQLYNLIPVLTAEENVELPLLLTKLSKKKRIEQARTALEIVGLGDRLATDPTLLVADEPTGDLDARNAEEILDLLQRLNGEFGKTIIMVTHDPKAAARASRILHLDKGNLAEGAYGTENEMRSPSGVPA
jgi:putative ABC transport system ATP-binding protein